MIRSTSDGARLGVALVVAFAVSGKAYAAKPLPPLPWDAIARTTESVSVREWECQLSNKETKCELTPTVVCLGNLCGSVVGQAGLYSVETRFVTKRHPARWAGLIIPPAMVVGGGAMRRSQNEGVVSAGEILVGVGVTVLVLAPVNIIYPFISTNSYGAGPFLTSEVTAFLRQRYPSDRTTYLFLRDEFNACTLSNESPLEALPAARSSARASCDTFRAELQKNPRLADPFAEALTEANAAAAAWDAVPMLQRVASGDYLGFYQARDTFKLAALPEPVVADTCGRLADATEGRAISDTILRKKLAEWTRESCAEKPRTERRRAKE